MKKLIKLFVVLLAAIALGYCIHLDTGYVLLTYHGWQFETSLWFAIAACIALWIVLKIVWRCIAFGYHMPQNVASWHQNNQKKKTERQSSRACHAAIFHNWKTALKCFQRACRYDKSKNMVNALGAVFCAHHLDTDVTANKELENLHKHLSDKNGTYAKVFFFMQTGQWANANHLLSALHTNNTKHKGILRLYAKTLLNIQDWKNLNLIFKKARPQLSPQDCSTIETALTMWTIDNCHDETTLEEAWSKKPKTQQYNPDVLAHYIEKRQLLQLDMSPAVTRIEKQIKHQWNDQLVLMYGQLNTRLGAHQLETAQKWLKQQPDQAIVLTTLGMISMKQQLWGLAEDYLQSALDLAPSRNILYSLAELAERSNNLSLALHYHKRASTL